MNSREVVLDILMDIETRDTFSHIAIDKALSKNQFEDKRDRAFVTRIAKGVVEHIITLDYIINLFSKTETGKCKPLIRCILRMSAYQIVYMESVPDSAACNSGVKLAKSRGLTGLSGFVNGVLRNISRNKNNIKKPPYPQNSPEYLSIEYSTPLWICRKLAADYPDCYVDILKDSFRERPTTIRVNENKITRDDLVLLLNKNGISSQAGFYDDKALLISGYDFIKKVPGYRQGYFTVQDESSMCAIRAAGIRPGDTVIDVCAAPGGKTTCAGEYLKGEGHIYSMDISQDKLALIEESVERLGIENADISCHDATILIEGMKADVVIADLPCSGMGVMGRKSDIKYRLREEQLKELSGLQRDILNVAGRYVKPGGRLCYSTCTINPEENQENVKWFLEQHKDFILDDERLFLQGIDKCDGFFYAIMTKR